MEHLKMKGNMNFGPQVLGFLHERVALNAWLWLLRQVEGLGMPLQGALMASNEPYNEIVERNRSWSALFQSARAASAESRVAAVREIRCLAALGELDLAGWAGAFDATERLAGDVVV